MSSAALTAVNEMILESMVFLLMGFRKLTNDSYLRKRKLAAAPELSSGKRCVHVGSSLSPDSVLVEFSEAAA